MQSVVLQNSASIQLRFSEGPEVSTLPIADTELQTTRLNLPKGFLPLGMMTQRYGYLIDEASPEVLWLYDYQQQSFSELISYRDSGATISPKIVFNERWLVWVEQAPYQLNEDGIMERQVRLMARELAKSDQADRQLAIGSNTLAQSYAPPFASLGLSEDNLIYRYCSFASGQRETEVRLQKLTSDQVLVLDSRSFANQELINQCSIYQELVVWDVQHRYLKQQKHFPDTEQAVYSLLACHLDGDEAGKPRPETLSNNNTLYSPVAHLGRVFALFACPPEYDEWIHIDEKLAIWNRQKIRTSIVTLDIGSVASVVELLKKHDYAARKLNAFTYRNIPLEISYKELHLGQRLLSWQSNIGDVLYVYDVHQDISVQLEHDFADAGTELTDLRVAALPGLDADYLLFSLISGREDSYILRVE